MRLHTKLFLSVGILIVALGAVLFFLPWYFIEIDLKQGTEKVHALLHKEEVRNETVESELIQTLQETLHGLADKIAIQTLAVILISLLLALIVLERIASSFTKPLTILAGAAENVAGGKYREIRLIPVGERKDEVATLTRAFEGMVKGLKEREQIRGVLNKVVSKDVAEEILKKEVHLGGEDRVVTMLFSDIRNFTKQTENFTPQKTITMLNTLMTKMSRIIEGEGGIIDKYIGDEIMALYGAPVAVEDHALRAISSAMLMIETLKKWNEERKEEGEEPLSIGIGIHSGLVVAGNMGAEDRLNYTVIGRNVNLAARLCQIAKPMQLIISEATLKEPKIKDSFAALPLEPLTLKGFREPITIYQIVGFKW